MLTRLEVDGFKSLRGLAVDLEPFTVFVGPNGSGKSNFLDAIMMLSRLATERIDDAFRAGRGSMLEQFTRIGDEPTRTIRFAAELFTHGLSKQVRASGQSGGPTRWRYELALERRSRASGTDRIAVVEERLRAIREDEDQWIRAHPEYRDDAEHGDFTAWELEGERGARWLIRELPGSYDGQLTPPKTHTVLASLSPFRDQFVGVELASVCQVRSFDLSGIRAVGGRLGGEALLPDGSNLAAVIADLEPQRLGALRADLASIIPGIASVEVSPEGDGLRIDFKLSDGERLPARLASDGTLRILALLALLHRAEEQPTVLIEEPENGVHPGRLRELISTLRDATTRWPEPEYDPTVIATGAIPLARELPAQILIATHSPIVLAQLRSQLETLRFVDLVKREHGRATRIRPVGTSEQPDRGRTAVSPREVELLLESFSADSAA